MKTSLRQIGQDLRTPCQKAMLLLALIPLFPEYISFFLVIASAIFAWKDLKQSGRPIQVSFMGKLLLAYIAYMVITLVYSKNRMSTLLTILMWAFFFIVYLILNNILSDTDRYDSLMLYITGVAGCVGFIACCQYRIGFYTNGNPIQLWEWLDNIVYQYLPIDISHTPYKLRACATFSNPNVLSEYLSAVAPFVVYFNFYERRKELRLFCRVCLFLTFGGILFSFCRGGYLALLVLCIALIVLNIRHRFASVSLYSIGALLLLPDEVVERFLTIIPGVKVGGVIVDNAASGGTIGTTADIINGSAADFATNERFRIWMQSLTSFLENPVLGHGAGVETTNTILTEAGIKAIHTHNIVLQLLVEGGLIALIIMLLIGAKVIKNGIELMRNNYGYAYWIGFAVLGFAACFIIQGMVDYPLMTPKLVCNFMTIIAIAERSNILYPGKGIEVRSRIRQRLKITHRVVTAHRK